MFKKLNTYILSSAVTVIALVAAVGIKPACSLFWYEPEIPAELKK